MLKKYAYQLYAQENMLKKICSKYMLKIYAQNICSKYMLFKKCSKNMLIYYILNIIF